MPGFQSGLWETGFGKKTRVGIWADRGGAVRVAEGKGRLVGRGLVWGLGGGVPRERQGWVLGKNEWGFQGPGRLR